MVRRLKKWFSAAKNGGVGPRRGQLLGPLWADGAEILCGKRARVWLQMIQISLGWVELRGSSGQKTEKMVKNWRFSPVLARVAQRHGRLLGPLWADPA